MNKKEILEKLKPIMENREIQLGTMSKILDVIFEEKMYSREEVINLIERFNKERCGQPWFEDDDKWIEENL